MKKILLLLLIVLSGCVSYECINDPNKKESFCMNRSDFNTLTGEGKEKDYIFDVIRSSSKVTECPSTEIGGLVLADWLYPSHSYYRRICPIGEKQKSQILYWKELEKEYIDKKEYEYEQAKEEEKEYEKQKKQQAVMYENLRKKTGIDWCSPKNFGMLLEQNNGNLPRNCMFEEDAKLFSVLQQTSDGTIIHDVVGENIVYFIEKNKVDSDSVDNAFIKEGVFVNIGTYKYTNVLGATRTIYRLKRIQ